MPVNIKRVVTVPPYDSECAREAVKTIPGIKGVVVSNINETTDRYQILVESNSGIDSIQLYGNSEKQLILSGSAWTKEGASAVELEKRAELVNKLLDAIQLRCGVNGAQQGAPGGRLRRRWA